MDFQKYLQDTSSANSEEDELLSRIAKVIEQDPDLALFGVSLAYALQGQELPREQVANYLSEVEERLSQI